MGERGARGFVEERPILTGKATQMPESEIGQNSAADGVAPQRPLEQHAAYPGEVRRCGGRRSVTCHHARGTPGEPDVRTSPRRHAKAGERDVLVVGGQCVVLTSTGDAHVVEIAARGPVALLGLSRSNVRTASSSTQLAQGAASTRTPVSPLAEARHVKGVFVEDGPQAGPVDHVDRPKLATMGRSTSMPSATAVLSSASVDTDRTPTDAGLVIAPSTSVAPP